MNSWCSGLAVNGTISQENGRDVWHDADESKKQKHNVSDRRQKIHRELEKVWNILSLPCPDDDLFAYFLILASLWDPDCISKFQLRWRDYRQRMGGAKMVSLVPFIAQIHVRSKKYIND